MLYSQPFKSKFYKSFYSSLKFISGGSFTMTQFTESSSTLSLIFFFGGVKTGGFYQNEKLIVLAFLHSGSWGQLFALFTAVLEMPY